MLKQLSLVEPKTPEWLWHPYIPSNCITLLEGDPGVGKSFLTLYLASQLSKGETHWPNNSVIPSPGSPSLFLATEDPLAEVIRPRAEGLKADLTKIWVESGILFLNDEGIDRIKEMIDDVKPSLVVIDPITALFDAGVDTYRANDVRARLRPLAIMAEECQCAFVVIRHWNKNTNAQAFHRGLGSVDFSAIARSMVSVYAHGSDVIFAHTKHNFGPLGPSLSYTIKNGEIFWSTPSETVAPLKNNLSASDWLLKHLADGAKSSTELRVLAIDEGYRYWEIRKAKDELGILSVKAQGTNGQWIWRLPEKTA